MEKCDKRSAMGPRKKKPSNESSSKKRRWYQSRVVRNPVPHPGRAIPITGKMSAPHAIFAVCGLVFLAGAVALGADMLDSHVDLLLLRRPAPQSRLQLPGVPAPLRGLADADIRELVSPLLEQPWTQPDLCKRMAQRIERVGWVRTLHHVRRLPDGTFKIACDYREPVAIVSGVDGYVLVDAERFRLPGVYAYHQSWIVIDGVREPPAVAGETWPGEDLRAGVTLVRTLAAEPFAEQITAVLVENVAGRVDPYRCHIELATDRAGGRIRWGSAPGAELEENSVEHKLAILRANYARTGRVDANHPIIDISTFPDRFTIPG